MSCLFNSLGKLTNQDPDALRNQICNYIARNPQLIEGVNSDDIVQWESGLNLDRYVFEMRKSSTWGGAIELKAFADLFGISVHVVDVRDHPSRVIKIEPSQTTTHSCHLVLNWSGNHYSPSAASRHYTPRKP
jgi:hypothetical protein